MHTHAPASQPHGAPLFSCSHTHARDWPILCRYGDSVLEVYDLARREAVVSGGFNGAVHARTHTHTHTHTLPPSQSMCVRIQGPRLIRRCRCR
jgi:hypothetical protein